MGILNGHHAITSASKTPIDEEDESSNINKSKYQKKTTPDSSWKRRRKEKLPLDRYPLDELTFQLVRLPEVSDEEFNVDTDDPDDPAKKFAVVIIKHS